MATRSNIGIQGADGKIKAIYCHWDGYPSGVGATLAEHYTDLAKVEALLDLGDFSSLMENVEEIKSYAELGATDTEARLFDTVQDWIEHATSQDAEFIYLFEYDPYSGWGWNYYALGSHWVSLPSKSQLVQA